MTARIYPFPRLGRERRSRAKAEGGFQLRPEYQSEILRLFDGGKPPQTARIVTLEGARRAGDYRPPGPFVRIDVWDGTDPSLLLARRHFPLFDPGMGKFIAGGIVDGYFVCATRLAAGDALGREFDYNEGTGAGGLWGRSADFAIVDDRDGPDEDPAA